MMSGLLSDARWSGHHGIGRFAREVLRRLPEHAQLERGPKPLSLADPLWLLSQVRRRKPRVYFSPGFNPPPACPVPLVFTVHDLIQIRLAEIATPAKRLYYEWILKPACRCAFRVLTVSEHSRRDILRWSKLPENRVVNVGNGVAAPFQPEGPRFQPGYPYVLYVGSNRPHKNLGRLSEAFQRLRRPDLHLVLAGPGLDRAGLPRRTHTLSDLSDQALARLYRGASLLVLPSLMEGFGLPALEAMACGTPVVVSNIPALREVAGDAGVYVDPLDIDDIHRAIERGLSPRAPPRAAGIHRAALFTWDAVAARVRSVLEAAFTETSHSVGDLIRTPEIRSGHEHRSA